ncbi:MAG: lipopolysaccharide transport periplasmic protein LptA, partial [Paracoccaceae bacterium]
MLKVTVIALFMALAGGIATAQSANIALGTSAFDRTQQVEVSADELSIDQSNGQAVFAGNVLVVQGEVRMSAGRVAVVYAQTDGAANGISSLKATGGVTFVTAKDAVEAREATYSVEQGTVQLSGDVILTQGQNAISGEKLVVDLNSGQGRMEGRVRTIFTPAG